MDKQEQYMDKYMTSVQGFNKTVRDIPHTAVLKETVGNRPYSTFVVIASFLFFFGFIMPKIRIPMFIAAAVVFVAMYLFHNKPILKIYKTHWSQQHELSGLFICHEQALPRQAGDSGKT